MAGFPVVLVAEDEAVIAMALADDLEAAGYAVAGAFATCESALEWLKGETPDLAVLDPMLKDGICKELAIELSRRGVPIVIYSGNREDRTLMEELNDATWIEKPSPIDTLLVALVDLSTAPAAASVGAVGDLKSQPTWVPNISLLNPTFFAEQRGAYVSETSNPSRNAGSDPNPNESAVDATAEGSRARTSGGIRTSCPYPPDSEECEEWLEGYDGNDQPVKPIEQQTPPSAATSRSPTGSHALK